MSLTGQARDARELFEFEIVPYVGGGFLLTIRYSGDGPSNLTGAGVWPTIEKAQQTAHEIASLLLHGAAVTWK